MLYLIQFSNYLFSFIIIPYQARIMGPTYFGKIGFVTALMVYFQLFTDFGFILSATEEVAKNREDVKQLCIVYTTVSILKFFLAMASVVLLLILCLFISEIRSNFLLYFLYLIGVVLYSFLPDYLYRGMERMSAITKRTILIKLLFTISIFFFIKEPDDYIFLPVLIALGNFSAVVWAHWHVTHFMNVSFCEVSVNNIYETFKKSTSFFLSRIAASIYTATNTMILGFLDNFGNMVGYYTVADRLTSAGKSTLGPIADSVYPYMIKNKDFRLIKKILLVFMPLICGFCIIVFMFSEKICVMLFGPEYAYSAIILKVMIPMAIIALPNYLFGFPTLGAMGLTKHANRSIFFASLMHVVNLIILYLLGYLNVVTLAILASVTDSLVLAYRILIIYKNKSILKDGC